MTLYSNGCIKCETLKEKLASKNINYNTSNDFDKLINAGFETLPVLEISENKFLNFSEAIKHINNL